MYNDYNNLLKRHTLRIYIYLKMFCLYGSKVLMPTARIWVDSINTQYKKHPAVLVLRFVAIYFNLYCLLLQIEGVLLRMTGPFDSLYLKPVWQQSVTIHMWWKSFKSPTPSHYWERGSTKGALWRVTSLPTLLLT